jgi:Transposase IS66 family
VETLAQVGQTTAIRYAMSRWDALTRYIEDRHIQIENNAAERSLRGIVMGWSATVENYETRFSIFTGSSRTWIPVAW